ncbi:LON peptidase substrate-binding domain-containing protein [Candidatus Dependentiae bacterium]|nr:LON peptidase substrate-binding domain-containing protein [Candidatus Dependentiae bacterium]
MKKTNKKQLQEKIPNLIPIIPTIDVVVFPNMVVPLLILDEKIIEGINKSLDGDKKVLLLAAKQPENSSGPIGVEDLYKVGTIANIMRTMQLPDGGIKILAQGMAKAEVEEIEQDETSLYALIKPIDIDTNKEDQNKLITLQRKIIALVEQLSATGKIFGPDFQILLSQMEEPERVAEFIISHLTMTVTQAQELLEKKSMIETFESIYDQLTNEIEISKVQDNIQNNTRESINKSQREYFLREQLKSIHKELGDEVESDMEEMKSKIATLPIEQEAKEEATRQLRRLERTSPDSMESTVLRNHIEWIINLPWGVYTKDDIDIPRAKKFR